MERRREEPDQTGSHPRLESMRDVDCILNHNVDETPELVRKSQRRLRVEIGGIRPARLGR